MMPQNKIMSASMMMSQEIDKLTAEYKEATSILGSYDVHQNADWREYKQQVIKCSILAGKIDILHKMIDQLSAMNIELPQLTSV